MAQKKKAVAKKAAPKAAPTTAKKTAQKTAKKVAKSAAKKSAASKPTAAPEANAAPAFLVGAVCHTELNTTDLGGAENFYKKLFGWKITSMDVPDFGRYLMISTGGPNSFGGIGQQPDPNAPPSWLTYFYVKNVDAAIKQVESLGGKTVMPAMDIGQGMGRIGVVSDPQGAVFGLYTQ